MISDDEYKYEYGYMGNMVFASLGMHSMAQYSVMIHIDWMIQPYDYYFYPFSLLLNAVIRDSAQTLPIQQFTNRIHMASFIVAPNRLFRIC
jgi:hypothetical protein